MIVSFHSPPTLLTTGIFAFGPTSSSLNELLFFGSAITPYGTSQIFIFPHTLVFNPAAVDYFEDSLYMGANEPSLGLYRIYEHIGRAVPAFAVKKVCDLG